MSISTRPSLETRRQMLLEFLVERPWSSAKMLSQEILEETGGAPAMMTGATWIAPWVAYEDLVALEKQGLVERRKITGRQVWWKVVG